MIWIKFIAFVFETIGLKLSNIRRSTPKTWYTSDTHFGHANVIKYCGRPFPNVKLMDWAMVKRWNAMVKPIDSVVVVGDFTMNTNAMERVTPLLNGEKYLVPGNHDSPFKNGKHSDRYEAAGWTILPIGYVQQLKGFVVKVHHLPYLTNSTRNYDIRYANRRPIYDAKEPTEDFLIHGHLHCMYFKNENMIDVGFDRNFRLISEEELIEVMRSPERFIPTRRTEVK